MLGKLRVLAFGRSMFCRYAQLAPTYIAYRYARDLQPRMHMIYRYAHAMPVRAVDVVD